MSEHEDEGSGDVNEVGEYCPNCGAEYRPGFATCSDCGTELLPGRAPVAAETEPAGTILGHRPDDLVHPVSVASFPWEEAWLAAGMLRSEGIPARVYPDHVEMPIVGGQAFGGSSFSSRMLAEVGLGRTDYDVMVPEEVATEARHLLAHLPSSH